jgi:hypothetical protein
MTRIMKNPRDIMNSPVTFEARHINSILTNLP